MNNKKIIFGILLFIAISFIAFTFANPQEEEEGTLIPGNNSTNVNNPNSANENDDKEEDNNDIVKIEDDNNTPTTPTVNTPPTNNTAANPQRPNTSRPSTPSGGSNSGSNNGGNSSVPVYHRVNVVVNNGTSNESSKNVLHGSNETFTITPNDYFSLTSAEISGGCVLNGNTLSAVNVLADVTCTVTLNKEKIYSSISAKSLNANETVNVSKNSDGTIVLTGTIAPYPNYNTIGAVDLVVTAGKILPEKYLKNLSVYSHTHQMNVISYNDIINKDSAIAGQSKAYFEIQQLFHPGDIYEYTIDWGNGVKANYKVLFDIKIQK